MALKRFNKNLHLSHISHNIVQITTNSYHATFSLSLSLSLVLLTFSGFSQTDQDPPGDFYPEPYEPSETWLTGGNQAKWENGKSVFRHYR
jgi:hypothetical protein